MQTLLDMRSIRKTFPGVVALNEVNLRVRAGEAQAHETQYRCEPGPQPHP